MKLQIIAASLSLFLAGCAMPVDPVEVGEDIKEPPSCEVFLFTWQDTWDDEIYQAVKHHGEPSTTDFVAIDFEHYRTGIHPAWIYFGYWRDHAEDWQLQVSVLEDDTHVLQLFGPQGQYEDAPRVPNHARSILGQWVSPELANRLLSSYDNGQIESLSGGRMGEIELSQGDLQITDYLATEFANIPFPPERSWFHAEGAYVISTPNGNWSLRVPFLQMSGDHFNFYADVWWNGGMEIRQDGENITDAWEALYNFAEAEGFRIPTSMVHHGPRPCNSDPRSNL